MPGKAAFGCIVSFGTATGTATTATLANVTGISGLDAEVSQIDVTSHDSAGSYREMVPSFIDPGQVKIDLNFDQNSATHKAITGGIQYLRDQKITTQWEIKFPGTPTTKVGFQAFVASTPIDLPFDDKQTMAVTLQLSGSQTWTYGT